MTSRQFSYLGNDDVCLRSLLCVFRSFAVIVLPYSLFVSMTALVMRTRVCRVILTNVEQKPEFSLAPRWFTFIARPGSFADSGFRSWPRPTSTAVRIADLGILARARARSCYSVLILGAKLSGGFLVCEIYVVDSILDSTRPDSSSSLI